MRLLLDTNVLIWVSGDRSHMGKKAYDAILSLRNDVYVSVLSAWEIAIKVGLGKLRFPIDDYAEILDRLMFETLTITHVHATAAGRLPPHHKDLFDRMLIAQARLEGLTLVTSDAKIAHYDVPLLSARA